MARTCLYHSCFTTILSDSNAIAHSNAHVNANAVSDANAVPDTNAVPHAHPDAVPHAHAVPNAHANADTSALWNDRAQSDSHPLIQGATTSTEFFIYGYSDL